jgi:hypothetical protein
MCRLSFVPQATLAHRTWLTSPRGLNAGHRSSQVDHIPNHAPVMRSRGVAPEPRSKPASVGTDSREHDDEAVFRHHLARAAGGVRREVFGWAGVIAQPRPVAMSLFLQESTVGYLRPASYHVAKNGRE